MRSKIVVYGQTLIRALTEFETDWITLLSPFAGTVPGTAKGSVDVTVNFDATGLENETKTANIVIANNANYTSSKGDDYIVPVTMNVNPAQPLPPANVNIEIVAEGDSVKISWNNQGYIYRIYSSDTPYSSFPGASWTLEATVSDVGEVTIVTAVGEKKFYVVTTDNTLPAVMLNKEIEKLEKDKKLLTKEKAFIRKLVIIK